jgi:hypothetical protein
MMSQGNKILIWRQPWYGLQMISPHMRWFEAHIEN